jgi:hypothetical protein
MDGVVREHARHAVHRDLLDQPGRRGMQGLRAQLRGGAALACDDAGREAPDLAPHHDGRHGLAFQHLCRTGARRRVRGLRGACLRRRRAAVVRIGAGIGIGIDGRSGRLAQAPNLAIATLWAHALRADGIAVSVQREFLGGAIGQLPPDQCLPEIWVEDDAQFAFAEKALHELQNRPQRSWRCSACGEWVEGGFEQCWRCGEMMAAGG